MWTSMAKVVKMIPTELITALLVEEQPIHNKTELILINKFFKKRKKKLLGKKVWVFIKSMIHRVEKTLNEKYIS